jgi:hypothetical protein
VIDLRFERLIKRYKEYAASPEEQQELFELIQSDVYDNALLEDISNTLRSTCIGPLHIKDDIREETFYRIARE